jgi:hypothetical protein
LARNIGAGTTVRLEAATGLALDAESSGAQTCLARNIGAGTTVRLEAATGLALDVESGGPRTCLARNIGAGTTVRLEAATGLALDVESAGAQTCLARNLGTGTTVRLEAATGLALDVESAGPQTCLAVNNHPTGTAVEAQALGSGTAVKAVAAQGRAADLQSNGPETVKVVAVAPNARAVTVQANGSSSRAVEAVCVAPGGFAGHFTGNVHVAGNLSKTLGSFKIDHPLDPANRYLSHSFVESPDMMNIYNGNITTDENGFAKVVLPDWFEALNRDFRYQLTVLGEFAQAIVAEKVHGNEFTIRTDKPGIEVSWQVTGIRKDAYAAKHPIVVEEDKTTADRGRYLNPDAYGEPIDKAIGYSTSGQTVGEEPAEVALADERH